ncbi:hypothetical protein [Rhodoflexus sp.]
MRHYLFRKGGLDDEFQELESYVRIYYYGKLPEEQPEGIHKLLSGIPDSRG